MPQSPHRLRNDLKCVELDVKPYYTHSDIVVVFVCDLYGHFTTRKKQNLCQQARFLAHNYEELLLRLGAPLWEYTTLPQTPNYILRKGERNEKREESGRTGKRKRKERGYSSVEWHDKLSRKIESTAQIDILTTQKSKILSLLSGTFPVLKTITIGRERVREELPPISLPKTKLTSSASAAGHHWGLRPTTPL